MSYFPDMSKIVIKDPREWETVGSFVEPHRCVELADCLKNEVVTFTQHMNEFKPLIVGRFTRYVVQISLQIMQR